jgi:hypothetical protein
MLYYIYDFHYQNQLFIFFLFLHACYYYTLQIDTNSLAALGCLLVDDTYDTDIESDLINSEPCCTTLDLFTE